MSDEIEDRFAELSESVPAHPRPELITAARGEGAGLRSRRRRTMRTRIALVTATGVGLLGFSLTPPGRAATDWIAEVAGIGEEPTLPQVGSVEGSAVVLASGTLPDGTPYEVVAKRFNGESFVQGAAESEQEAQEMIDRGFGRIEESVCFQIDWPRPGGTGQGGSCTRRPYGDRGPTPGIEASWVQGVPKGANSGNSGIVGSQASARLKGPAVFMGIVEDPQVAELRVVQVDREGAKTELPAQLLTVDGELLARLDGRNPVSVFFAVLDEDVVAAGNAREAQVRAIALDADGDELDRTDAFPPLDCPVDPSVLLPTLPPIPDAPSPVVTDEAEAMQRAIECGAEPVAPSKVYMEQGPLEREPLPPRPEALAADLGMSLEPATHDELASVFAEDFTGSTAIDAVRLSPQEVPGSPAGYQGPMHIYLARDAAGDRLVYVVHRTVKALIHQDRSRERETNGLPREYLSVIDVTTGATTLEEEIE